MPLCARRCYYCRHYNGFLRAKLTSRDFQVPASGCNKLAGTEHKAPNLCLNMHWFFQNITRRLFRSKPNFAFGKKSIHNSPKMSSASTSVALYAAVSSPAQLSRTQPEEAKELRHHLQNGQGFTNPWDSFRDRGVGELLRAMLWYAILPLLIQSFWLAMLNLENLGEE